jgi:hypothetical protein
MGHKLKKLGVSLVAVLALSLVITSISAAAQFTSSSYPTTTKAEGTESYGYATVEGSSIECSSGSASATLSAASSTLTIVEGKASKCSAFGFAEGTVNSEGCAVLVHVTGGSGDTYTGTSDLLCPAGQSVKTVAGSCKTEVKPQTGSVTLELLNNTGGGYVEVKLKTSNVAYTVTQDGFLCPLNGTGNKTGGTAVQTKTGTVKVAGRTISIS